MYVCVWSQESQKVALQLQQEVQLAVREADILRVTLEERERSRDQTTGEPEQHLRHWAQELGAECQRLRLLVEQRGAKQGSEVSAPRYYEPRMQLVGSREIYCDHYGVKRFLELPLIPDSK